MRRRGDGRAIRLAEIAGAPLYVVHVSSAMAADAISDGRKRGLPIYGETCPQYLVCDTTDYERPDFAGAKYVMSPPMRDKWNQNVLLAQTEEHASCRRFGSDHCSFNLCGQKELGKDDFSKIPNGAPTIEDRVAILYERGVNGGIVGLNQFVALDVDESGQTVRALSAQGHDRGRQRRRHRRLGSERERTISADDAPHERRQQHLRRHDDARRTALRALARPQGRRGTTLTSARPATASVKNPLRFRPVATVVGSEP